MSALEKAAPMELERLRFGFTLEQVDVIKATIAPGVTNDELALFMMVCQKTGLDPFSRQIYLSERRSFDKDNNRWTVKKTPETTIDGFRVIAERSGHYAGQIGPFWCGDDGEWKDVWLSRQSMPSAAKVGILRDDFKEPVWGIALFEEYVQTNKEGKPNSMWSKMGANQLAKCAESLGLRKAFPRDLSGMYSREEMAQAEERSSKEAQSEVLARKLKQIPAGSEISAAELATAAPSYEERSQQRVEEANATFGDDSFAPPGGWQGAAKQDSDMLDVPDKPKRKRGSISFEALKDWGHLKAELSKYLGTDACYYAALQSRGYQHADEIKTKEDAATIWKVLTAERSRLSQDAELKALFNETLMVLGGVLYLRILSNNGVTTTEEAMTLDGTSLTGLLTELKAAVDHKQKRLRAANKGRV